MDTTPPVLVSATLAGVALSLLYDEPLQTTGVSASEFAVTINGFGVRVIAAAVNGRTVTISIARPPAPGDTVRVSYARKPAPTIRRSLTRIRPPKTQATRLRPPTKTSTNPPAPPIRRVQTRIRPRTVRSFLRKPAV